MRFIRPLLSVVACAGLIHAQSVGSFVTSRAGCPGLVSDIGAGDETVQGPFDLGFSFPHGGGNGFTTAIEIASNGYIYLEPGTIQSSRCCNGAVGGAALPEFFSDTPSFALFGQDLDPGPAGGGAVWFETDNSSVATITWQMVAEAGIPGSSNTFQVQLQSDGRVVMCFTNVANSSHEALVGFSPGGGAVDPGAVDFSTVPAAPVIGVPGEAIYETFTTGTVDLTGLCITWIPDGFGSYVVVPNGATRPCCVAAEPLTIRSVGVPTIGQSIFIDVSGVPASTSAGSLLIGAGRFSPAVDLGLLDADECFLYTLANIGAVPFATLTPPTATLTLPISADPGAVGLTFETQAATISPGVNTFGLATSNLGSMTVGDTNPIRITASGASSFNNVTTSGFWKVANGGSVPIVGVQFDWANSSRPNNFFDTDQISMADRFDGGNSTSAGCRGTYRNGTDVSTGLVYASTSVSGCDPNARTGWVGSNPATGIGDFKTLDFTFNSFDTGDVFELDIDTDGGAANGGAMAGMVVTVTLLGGRVRTGALVMVGAGDSRLDL